MEGRNLEDKTSGEEAGAAGSPSEGDIPGISFHYRDDADAEFASEQPYHEDAWEEEDIPLSGEINAVDTFITGEQFRDDPFDKLEGPSDLTQVSEDDPFDAYRADDYAAGAAPTGRGETEFAGELAPAPAGSAGFGRVSGERNDAFHAADNGGIQEEVPEGNRTFGWIAIILAIVSLFYWPAVLGPSAAVFGVIAYMRGNRALGAWSVVLGLLALLAFLFLVPYYS